MPILYFEMMKNNNHFMKCRNAAFFILCFSCFVSCYRSEQADLVIHNAYIITVDPQDSQVEAMAIKDGKIIALGAEREILNRYQAAETIDARKKIIYPGFIDAHAHFLGYATNKGELSLHGVQSQAELIARVEKFAASSAREWIVGRGWDRSLVHRTINHILSACLATVPDLDADLNMPFRKFPTDLRRLL